MDSGYDRSKYFKPCIFFFKNKKILLQHRNEIVWKVLHPSDLYNKSIVQYSADIELHLLSSFVLNFHLSASP